MRSALRAPIANRLAPLVVMVVALGVGLWVRKPLSPGVWNDDGVYLMLGLSLVKGHGLRYVGVPGTPVAPKFPPVYPAVAAVAWILGRDARGAAQAAAAMNVVFLSGAVGLICAYAARALRLPIALAFAASALAALSVDLWRPAMVALSEPLYVLIMMAALWAAARAEDEQAGRREHALLAALLVLLVYERTAGVAVVGAAVLGLVIRSRWRAASSVAIAVSALALPWMVWSSSAGAAIPAPLLDILGPYGGWLRGQVAISPLGYLGTLPEAALRVGHSTLELLVIDAHPLVWTIAAPLLVAALVAGSWSLGKRSPTAALALLGSLALAALWPFHEDQRLVMPVLPLLLLALACLADDLYVLWVGAKHGWRGSLAALGLTAVISWAVAFVAFSVPRLRDGEPTNGYSVRELVLARSIETMGKHVPGDAAVGSPAFWAAIHLLTGVRTVPSARFRPLAPGEEPIWGTPREQFRAWAAGSADYILTEGDVHDEALGALASACPGSVRLIDERPGIRLVRLEWDAACKRTVGALP